jgi:hypothetical protein
VLPVAAVFGAASPIGILTLSSHAHLGNAEASPGLFVFEGESLSTDADGRLSVRGGRSILTLAAKTQAVLVPIEKGVHVDVSCGSVHFSAAENDAVEMHANDAIVRPAAPQATQAAVTILRPNHRQIAADRGTLKFSYARNRGICLLGTCIEFTSMIAEG